MSAYVVDRDHIWFLVQCACEYELGCGTTQRHQYRKTSPNAERLALGQMLWRENLASVSSRYPEGSLPGPTNETYDLADGGIISEWPTIDPVQAIKSARCYAYQSCEHDGWSESSARALIDDIVAAAIADLPGYDAAEWGPPKQEPMRLSI